MAVLVVEVVLGLEAISLPGMFGVDSERELIPFLRSRSGGVVGEVLIDDCLLVLRASRSTYRGTFSCARSTSAWAELFKSFGTSSTFFLKKKRKD